MFIEPLRNFISVKLKKSVLTKTIDVQNYTFSESSPRGSFKYFIYEHNFMNKKENWNWIPVWIECEENREEGRWQKLDFFQLVTNKENWISLSLTFRLLTDNVMNSKEKWNWIPNWKEGERKKKREKVAEAWLFSACYKQGKLVPYLPSSFGQREMKGQPNTQPTPITSWKHKIESRDTHCRNLPQVLDNIAFSPQYQRRKRNQMDRRREYM